MQMTKQKAPKYTGKIIYIRYISNLKLKKKTIATNIEWIDVIVSTDDKIVKQKTAK